MTDWRILDNATNCKPCPFCGREPYKIKQEFIGDTPLRCFIVCVCGAYGPEAYTIPTAKRIWNRRKFTEAARLKLAKHREGSEL